MLVVLRFPKEPYWIEPMPGVRMKVRPGNTALIEAAKARAFRLLDEIVKEKSAIEQIGGTVEGLPDLDTEDGRKGLIELLFAQSLAVVTLLEWEGLVLELPDEGQEPEPAPLTEQNINALMFIPDAAGAFVASYQRRHEEVSAEGNG